MKTTALRRLLDRGLPGYRGRSPGRLSVTQLAAELKIAPGCIYVWFKQNRLPYRRAMQLARMPGTLLTFEQLQPFVTGTDDEA